MIKNSNINESGAKNMGPTLSDYDHIIVAYSGGKDSNACVLHLKEMGVDMSKVELWHHLVDGREGSTLMDWPVTEDYCQKFAEALDLPIFFSWKEGGFEREMLRNEQLTAPNHFEQPLNGDNLIECGKSGGIRGKNGTRLKFPQVSANLAVRWCSAYLKIDVCTAAINNQKRFLNKKTLVVTGERAEESAARAKYKTFEPDRSDNRNGKRIQRHVDHWRPVHAWVEYEVWAIAKRHKVNPHPAYQLGWSRLSCMSCIFGNDSQWASINKIAPDNIKKISDYEKDFGLTIHRTKAVMERVENASPYDAIDSEITKLALSHNYSVPILTDNWTLPAGAYGESAGPS